MTRRVFLSFDSDDLNLVNLFRGQTANPNLDIGFYDDSLKVGIDSSNAEYIKSIIRPKIVNASVIVCLIGKDTHTSRWVDWELAVSGVEKKGVWK